MAFDWDEIPTDEKCFIVVRGVPMVEGANSLSYAEEIARDMCPEPGDKATILLVPRASLTHALTAVNHGVVLHAMSSVENEED